MEHIPVNKHVRLEIVKLSMAAVIFEAIESDRNFLREWLPFIDSTLQVSDTEHYLENIIRQKHPKKEEIYSIWYKEEFAGLIGYKDTDWVNRKTEIGYWILQKMQGRGIVTSSVKELLKFAFKKLNMNRVQIKTGIGNEKSAAIPKRLGFQLEGVERDGEFHNGTFVDLEVYSLLKKEWRKM
ncbi:MAG: GNAT family N-acetyltransferase [Prolixibacteraceae bacterium]